MAYPPRTRGARLQAACQNRHQARAKRKGTKGRKSSRTPGFAQRRVEHKGGERNLFKFLRILSWKGWKGKERRGGGKGKGGRGKGGGKKRKSPFWASTKLRRDGSREADRVLIGIPPLVGKMTEERREGKERGKRASLTPRAYRSHHGPALTCSFRSLFYRVKRGRGRERGKKKLSDSRVSSSFFSSRSEISRGKKGKVWKEREGEEGRKEETRFSFSFFLFLFRSRIRVMRLREEKKARRGGGEKGGEKGSPHRKSIQFARCAGGEHRIFPCSLIIPVPPLEPDVVSLSARKRKEEKERKGEFCVSLSSTTPLRLRKSSRLKRKRKKKKGGGEKRRRGKVMYCEN